MSNSRQVQMAPSRLVDAEIHWSGKIARVLGGVSAIAIIWLLFLPWLGEQEGIRQHIELMQQAKIDPSAMYYSELGVINDAERSLRLIEREDPNLLWIPRAVY